MVVGSLHARKTTRKYPQPALQNQDDEYSKKRKARTGLWPSFGDIDLMQAKKLEFRAAMNAPGIWVENSGRDGRIETVPSSAPISSPPIASKM